MLPASSLRVFAKFFKPSVAENPEYLDASLLDSMATTSLSAISVNTEDASGDDKDHAKDSKKKKKKSDKAGSKEKKKKKEKTGDKDKKKKSKKEDGKPKEKKKEKV